MVKKRKRKYKKNSREDRYYESESPITSEAKKGIFIVVILVAAFLSILAIFDLAGGLGFYLKQALGITLGWGLYLFPLILIGLAYALLNPEKYEIKPSNYFGLFLLLISFAGLLQLMKNLNGGLTTFTSGSGGGYLGYALTFPLQKIMGSWATLITIIALFIISLLISFNTSLNDLLGKFNILSFLKRKVARSEAELNKEVWEEAEEEELVVEEEIEEKDETSKEPALFTTKKIPAPKTAKKVKQIPEGLNVTYASGKPTKVDIPLNLLDDKTSKPTSGDIKANIEKIQKTLRNFGIDVEMGGVNVGPTVTQFTLKPAHGIRLSQILTLQNDLALALAAHPIRIEAPIPGKALVGIEIPNQSIALVR